MSSVYNGIIARDDYAIAHDIFVNVALMDPKRIRMTSGDIRVEQPLTANTNQYTFPVLVNIQNQAQPFPSEVRLQQQDTMCVTQFGFFLANTAGSTDCAFQLSTYPNPVKFPTSYTQLNTIYQNGRLLLTIDNDVYIKQWGAFRHYKAPFTQQTAPVGAGSPIDQLDGVEDGFYPMQPFILLTGASDIQLNLNMNLVSPTTVDPNTRMVIIMRGFLAQMSTVIK